MVRTKYGTTAAATWHARCSTWMCATRAAATAAILTDNRNLVIITNSYAAPAYSGLLTPILAWHNNDLPTAREGIRNAMIESVQGNRNPFVDHPEWANTLFAGVCNGPDFVAVDDDFAGTEDTVLNRNSVNDTGVINDDQVPSRWLLPCTEMWR
jgi:hypothetical protein